MADETTGEPEQTVPRAEYDRIAAALERSIERQGAAQDEARLAAVALVAAQQRITELEAELAAALTPQEES
ncbi:hypothetical protein [Nocardioides massiliensis]|uniref:Uncharacterized protein n=1 Tax=Nocardioides massiliensis TaxID=1325935 RepID=A0ABT9NIX5_9ACTN|nr:hypothetical protein [Nocardioides massiliensis]MDP9820369.1 hypothetical protein [Nocardioides massiliensis]